MEKEFKVLFAPLGNTDPITIDRTNEKEVGRDGPLLHILRCEKPDAIQLFFTKELEDRNTNGDYQKWVDAVCPGIRQLEPIYSGIEDPSDFSLFIERYTYALNQLHDAHPDAEILLNVSSGTPQMISALIVIATTSALPLKCCQVQTPAKRGNFPSKTLSFDENLPKWTEQATPEKFERRLVKPKLYNYSKTLVLDSLKKLINNHQYQAAYHLTEVNQAYLSPVQLSAIRGAWHRKQLETDAAQQCFKEAGISFPGYALPGIEDAIEFYLGMRHDWETGDYIRFFARLSPLAEFIGEYYIKNRCKLVFQDVKYSPSKLRSSDPELYRYLENQGFDFARNSRSQGEQSMSTHLCLKIISYYKDKGAASEQAHQTYTTIQALITLRNQAAHQMTSMSENDVRILLQKKRQKKKDPSVPTFHDLLKFMDNAVAQFFLKPQQILPILTGSYTTMEQKIIKLLSG